MLVKEIKRGIDQHDIEKLALSIVDTLSGEHYIKAVVGIGTPIANVKDPVSYTHLEEEKAAAAGFGAGIAQSAPPAQSAASAGADTQQPASQVNTQPAASEAAAGQAEDVLAQTAGAWPTE